MERRHVQSPLNGLVVWHLETLFREVHYMEGERKRREGGRERRDREKEDKKAL